MLDPNFTFAKIVSMPSARSWSQAYNAGRLFAVLSITKTSQDQEETPLGLVGKEILDVLEQEYFVLEDKNLISIKEAITKTYEKTPENISICMVVASIVNNVLYVFAIGKGSVSIRRSGNLGSILIGSEQTREPKTASGFLENLDVIILETKQFSSLIPSESLNESLNNHSISEVAEKLSPSINSAEEGGAAVLMIAYKKEEILEEIPNIQILENKVSESKNFAVIDLLKKIPTYFPKLALPTISINKLPLVSIPLSKKILLILSIIFIAALSISVFITIRARESEKNKTIANNILKEAQKKYDEGVALAPLNKSIAREDFQAALSIIKEGKKKLLPTAIQQKDLDEFLTKIEKTLSSSANENQVVPTKADNASPSLEYAKKNPSVRTLTQNESFIYILEKDTIFSVDKKSQKKEAVIKTKDWTTPLALGVFLNNFYVLDKKEKIIKFTKTASTFAKSSYVKNDTSIDFSTSVSMAIDGSVYILLSNGTIHKFTKGEKEAFALSGLDKPFKDPIRIFTNADLGNLYVLDTGNSRIVLFSKNGAYQSQYAAAILKDAKEIDVSEKDKAIFLLSKDTVWKIGIK